jgi:hypothetical protein
VWVGPGWNSGGGDDATLLTLEVQLTESTKGTTNRPISVNCVPFAAANNMGSDLRVRFRLQRRRPLEDRLRLRPHRYQQIRNAAQRAKRVDILDVLEA